MEAANSPDARFRMSLIVELPGCAPYRQVLFEHLEPENVPWLKEIAERNCAGQPITVLVELENEPPAPPDND
jgi:hypothetical protein